jgi:amino-acid N-acetyltransferase
MMEPSFRVASLADLPNIVELLSASGLPVAGVEAHIDSFLLALQGGSLAACAGLERYGPTALLRSVAVAKTHRGNGLAQKLVAQLIGIARADGIESVLLLTTTAGAFFERFGFRTISRAEAPAAVQCSVEFQGACPASASVMRLDIHQPGSVYKSNGSTQSHSANSQSPETQRR